MGMISCLLAIGNAEMQMVSLVYIEALHSIMVFFAYTFRKKYVKILNQINEYIMLGFFILMSSYTCVYTIKEPFINIINPILFFIAVIIGNQVIFIVS